MLSKRRSKLSLSKQTVRVLTADQQRTVVGGSVVYPSDACPQPTVVVQRTNVFRGFSLAALRIH